MSSCYKRGFVFLKDPSGCYKENTVGLGGWGVGGRGEGVRVRMGARRSDLTQGDEHRVGEKWHSGCILKAGASSVA